MKELTLREKIENCCSHNLCALITQYRTELTMEDVQRILEKAIAMDMIFVVRRLNKYALLRKEHMKIVWRKCPRGYKAELEGISDDLC
ncbi:MAG: hypothetical protein J6M02_01685 [Clostridia bacterium]|nr:hypothetical protein [Clostridia bacterium]